MSRVTGFDRFTRLALTGALAAVLVCAVHTPAHAAEIIPSIGITQGTSDDAGDSQVFGNLAVRSNVMPMIAGELGIGYRSETMYDGLVEMQMWPITASVWATPTPMFYAGGGVGLYMTTVKFDDSLTLPSDSEQKFGFHAGGGFRIPLAPPLAALDINGRYVMMQEQDAQFSASQFDPDFWSMSAGLAIKF